METLNLLTIISKLIRLNKVVKEVKMNSEDNTPAASIVQEYLNHLKHPTNTNAIPVSRQLALEQVRFLN
ncbi:MAG TPA: hypothetical protein VD908_16280 [Cytophagales bacterium]|nr:hypothetical protein [Cytophagales bacterium]